ACLATACARHLRTWVSSATPASTSRASWRMTSGLLARSTPRGCSRWRRPSPLAQPDAAANTLARRTFQARPLVGGALHAPGHGHPSGLARRATFAHRRALVERRRSLDHGRPAKDLREETPRA